jgi:purine-binding chemotaxis protein CheW
MDKPSNQHQNHNENEHMLTEIKELQTRLDELRQRVDKDTVPEELPEGELKLLLCRIGEERAALLLEHVDEVVLMAKLSPLPEAPEWVAGVLNLRGKTIPVLDVLARLKRQSRPADADDSIIICQIKERWIGLIVQEIFDVFSCEANSLQTTRRDIPHARYLLGILNIDEQPVHMISVSRLVSMSDIPEDKR